MHYRKGIVLGKEHQAHLGLSLIKLDLQL